MKTRTAPILLLLLMFLQGCETLSTTPTQRWAISRESLTRSQNVILESHKAGYVSDQRLVAADKLVQSARRALARAEAQLPQGGKEFDNLIQLAGDVATALLTADTENTRKAVAAFKAEPIAAPVTPTLTP